MNYLVETKKEYTTNLINIISPFIFDGIQSLYEEACKIANDGEELKYFQSFLKKIPEWNSLLLETETKRILKESNCEDLLEQLLLAVIKSNIMVLTNTPPEQKHTIKLPQDIDFKKFIHHSYIETAKAIYENPFLFYHKFSVFDIKKNQRDAKDTIKQSIDEAIRKLLPLQYILNEYLASEIPTYNKPKENDFDKTISEANKTVLKQIIKAQNLDEPASSGLGVQINNLKEMLKNDPLDNVNIESEKPINNKPKICSDIQKSIKQETKLVKNNPTTQSHSNYVLKKVPSVENNKITSVKEEQEVSESVAYYKTTNSKLIDSFSNNKSNLKSIFYSNEPFDAKTKSVNTADVNNYLKEQGQTTMKMSDDPNINSIKNVNPEKFKNKYYQV